MEDYQNLKIASLEEDIRKLKEHITRLEIGLELCGLEIHIIK
jgi:hypothetical protein